MKNGSKCLFIILMLLININVSAKECSKDTLRELKKEASYIKASYEEAQEQIVNTKPNSEEGTLSTNPIIKLFFNIKFYNITSNISLQITNENTKKVTFVNYSDATNGTFVMEHRDILNVTTYSYKVLAASNNDCFNTLLKQGKITLPARNDYATFPECEGYEDLYFCKEYVTFDTSKVDVGKLLNEYKQKEREKQEDEIEETEEKLTAIIKKFLTKNKITIILIVAILIIGIVLFVIYKVKQRKKMIV